jgi:hypothetical protein
MANVLLVVAAITVAPAVVAGAELKTCRGVLTDNWTEGVVDPHVDNGTRLIRADNINNSCLFHIDSNAGKQILRTCKMGFACKVKVTLRDELADVYIIDKVISVESLSRN